MDFDRSSFPLWYKTRNFAFPYLLEADILARWEQGHLRQSARTDHHIFSILC